MHGARAVLRAASGTADQEIDDRLVWAFKTSLSTCRGTVEVGYYRLSSIHLVIYFFNKAASPEIPQTVPPTR